MTGLLLRVIAGLVVPLCILAAARNGANAQDTAPTLYHYAENGVQQGPVPLTVLRSLIQQKRINRKTLIWRPGYANWQAAETDRDVAALFQQSPAAAPTKFKDYAVYDVGRGNVEAFRLFVPEGWKFDGGLVVAPQFHMVPYFGGFGVNAPDGRHVEFAPLNEFGYSDIQQGQPLQNYLGRPFLRRPARLGEFLKLVTAIDPDNKKTNIEIVSEEVVPEATERLRAQMASAYAGAQQFNARWAMLGERMTFNAEVRRVVMRYLEDGKHLESTNFANMSWTEIALPNGAVKSANWVMSNVYAIGGPIGSDYANDPAIATVVRSLRRNPAWDALIKQWYQSKKGEIVRQGAVAASAARSGWKNTSATQTDDILDISFKGWKKRNEMTSAGQSNLVNSIHERTAYSLPTGQSVNLPSFYKHVFTDRQGNYVLHNNSNYDINTDPTFNGRDWQPIRQLQ